MNPVALVSKKRELLLISEARRMASYESAGAVDGVARRVKCVSHVGCSAMSLTAAAADDVLR